MIILLNTRLKSKFDNYLKCSGFRNTRKDFVIDWAFLFFYCTLFVYSWPLSIISSSYVHPVHNKKKQPAIRAGIVIKKRTTRRVPMTRKTAPKRAIVV